MKLWDLFTEADNQTLCPVRVGWALATLGYHGVAGWALAFQGAHVSMAALGAYVTHQIMLHGGGGLVATAKTRFGGDAK